jgi:hypothetical protein
MRNDDGDPPFAIGLQRMGHPDSWDAVRLAEW